MGDWVDQAVKTFIYGGGAAKYEGMGAAALGAFLTWARNGAGVPPAPWGIRLAEEQGGFVPFHVDAQAALDVLGVEAPEDMTCAQALDEALRRAVPEGRGAVSSADVLGAWADAIGFNDGIIDRLNECLSEALDSKLGLRAEDLAGAVRGLSAPEEAASRAAAGMAKEDDEGFKLAPLRSPDVLFSEGAPARRENPGWTPVEVSAELSGNDAILYNPGNPLTPYVAAFGYDPETNGWGQGDYHATLLEAYEDVHSTRLVDTGDPDVVGYTVFTRDDVADAVIRKFGLDGVDVDATVADAVEGAGHWFSDSLTEHGLESLDAFLPGKPVPEQPAPGEAERRYFFSRDHYLGLSDEEASEMLGLDDVEPAEDHEDELADLCWSDLDEEAGEISRAFEDRRFVAMATVGRWDGESSGFAGPYGDLGELLGDTGYDGVLKDCDIDSVWDEGGELWVRGVHHDGAATLRVRAVCEEQAEAFSEAMSWGGLAQAKRVWDEAGPAGAWDRVCGPAPTAGAGPSLTQTVALAQAAARGSAASASRKI